MYLGTLKDLILQKCDPKEENNLEPVLSLKQISLYICQILDGLQYIHERSIVHMDIKADNILMENYSKIRIADFGVSQTGLQITNIENGTPHWMAPEIINSLPFDSKVDVWSLGATVVEMVTGHKPFHKSSSANVLFKISTLTQVPSELLGSTSGSLKDFLTQTFQVDPNIRPTAEELLNHDFILEFSQCNQECNDSDGELDASNDIKQNQHVHCKLLQRFNLCNKNPDHRDFIQVQRLTLNQLPAQDTQLLKLVKNLAALTVKVQVLFDTDKYGTGFVNSVDIYNDVDDDKCPCPACCETAAPSTSWAIFYIITSTQLVSGDSEARHTTCFVNHDGSHNIKELIGLKTSITSKKRDRCVMVCYSHDIQLAYTLKFKLRNYSRLCKKMYKKYNTDETVNKTVLMISHPHGASKHLTLGMLADRQKQQKKFSSRLYYTNPSCNGCVGAPVYVIGLKPYSTNYTHSGVTKERDANCSSSWYC
ncbi:uncharacterized protein LOC131935251 [Physella acuta]|uniref:uncharacterized protein LOC131935251 n=1 Tax=Physella acuta TaxID=109671 RepID=UPI0027DE4A5B|nr:uncharacterized protein LOC131935251 [Physella acuta]